MTVTAWPGEAFNLNCKGMFVTLWGVEGRSVGQSIGGEVEGEQGHIPMGANDGCVTGIGFGHLSPHVGQDHGGFSSLVGGHAFQQTSVTMDVFGTIIVDQFQSILVLVFFTIDGHTDDRQPKLFKAERTASRVPIEGIIVQQPHDHAHGHAIGEELVLIKIRQAIGHGKSTDLGGNQRVHGSGFAPGRGDLSVERRGHSDLAQVQGELDIVLGQGSSFEGIRVAVGSTH